MHIVSMDYPTARRDEDSKDCMHGVEIEDPYRQLENAFADETKAFVEAQNELTSRYLAPYPHSVGLNDTLGGLSSFLSVRAFQRAPDGRFYWECKADGVPQPVMRRCDGPIDPEHFTGEEGEVFFDVNLLADDGRGTASFAWGSWSETGRYWATTISRGGSDRQSILIIDTTSKQQVDEELVDIKFCWALTWLGDEGFVYKHVPPKHPDDSSAEGGFKSAIHYIGSAQSSDVIIWEDPLNPQTSALVPEVSEDKKFLVVDFFRSTDPVSMLLVTPIKDRLGLNAERFTTPPVWTEQALPYDGTYRYLTTTSTGHSLFLTNRGSASRMKISSTVLGASASPPSSSSHPVWEDVIPEHPEGAVLGQAKALGQGLLLLVYSRDVGHELWIYTDDGRPVRQVQDREIPRSSMVKAITRGKGSMEFSIECWSYIAPPTLYRGVVADGDISFSIMHSASARGWNEPDYVQKQVFYKSKDGTLIPMHISHKRLLSLDDPHPTLLFGYGGFNWAQEPRWDPLFSAFMAKFNGIIAVAGIRGGGEYGVDWHQAAVKQKRQVAIDDFVAAAKWLKGEGKVASKLAIYGSSNGGLLCGAVCNQVPELIDAALPDVGVHDLLRFHLFTMGALWTAEYGNPEDVGDFQALLKLSPLHNVTNDLNYPAVFLTTAEHDSRVIPGHTLKMAATLQAKKTQNPAPILCRIYQNTGHGDGKTTDQQIREHAEKLTFLARAMELEYVE